MKKNWIQDIDMKKGALHKQLGIPEDKKIPNSLIDKILNMTPGDILEFDLGDGKKRVKITPTLLKRARLAKTLKAISK